MSLNQISTSGTRFLPATLLLFILLLSSKTLQAQIGRYWDQNLNSEAALLSGAVVAGEGGIAAIYYNPATISQMTKNNLSLSANLFSTYYFSAENALGEDLPADRVQLDVYPRIITLTLNPKKRPNLTIEMAYFTKTNEYMQINKGYSVTRDIIASNPGNENYAGDYYFRSKLQDNFGGAGFGFRLSDALSLGFSALVSYKDDQYFNLVTADAFTGPGQGEEVQYLSDSRFDYRHNMFDVRLVTKWGIHYKMNSLSLGATINLPSVKLFGNGTVVKQYEYSNIHKEGTSEASDLFWGGRQRLCQAHFKDPLSIAAGANYYSPSGNSIILLTAEYFFGIPEYDYIEASADPGEEGYNFTPYEPAEWLSLKNSHNPVFNAGIAFKKHVNDQLMISGGFRTDFNYMQPSGEPDVPEFNKKHTYILDVYHFNSGIGYNFKRGSIILGMQFSYGQDKNRSQIVNLTGPIEYISDSVMALTGPVGNYVTIKYLDVSVYFGFLFNFMKSE